MKTALYVLPDTKRPKLEEIIKWFYNAQLEMKHGVTTGELKKYSNGKISQQASSGSVAFLVDLKILNPPDKDHRYTLTDFGRKFGALIFRNAPDLSSLWEEAVRKSQFVMNIVYDIESAVYYEKFDLAKVIVSQAGKSWKIESSRRGATTILDILETADLIQITKINNEFRIIANKPKIKNPFILVERISTLQFIDNEKYDLSKMIELCKEINHCYEKEYYYAVGMLIRALLDHVPPIFNQKNWDGIINNYGGGGKSFKESMKTLDGFRDVFDKYIHSQISNKEDVANERQIDCKSLLDVLLGETIKILFSSNKPPS